MDIYGPGSIRVNTRCCLVWLYYLITILIVIIQVLLQHGADPRLFAEDGQMPEHVSSIMVHSWETQTKCSHISDTLMFSFCTGYVSINHLVLASCANYFDYFLCFLICLKICLPCSCMSLDDCFCNCAICFSRWRLRNILSNFLKPGTLSKQNIF